MTEPPPDTERGREPDEQVEPPSSRAGPTDAERRDHGLLRVVLVAVCLLLTFESLAGMARWRANRAELQGLLEGRTEEEAAIFRQRVEFEPSAHHAKLFAARTLVYDALTSGGEATGSVDAVVAGLVRARELALEVLDRQPNSWQASMFLGAATYLEGSLSSDRRLYTAAHRWEEPLLKARREARGKPEPRRFLASAYLETWAALSAEKKAFASEILRETFREDLSAFARLAPVWMEVAGDRERALELIPDHPEAWQLLERGFARRWDWEAFCMARSRLRAALEAKLERDLEEAHQRLRLGDFQGGRTVCLSVVARAPRDGRFAPLVSRALELYPPGLHGLRSKDALEEWLSWALELHMVSVDPFGPRVLGRLSDAVGELDPSVGALAALIGDDVYSTQRYEKLTKSMRGREWAPFVIAKSKWLVAREELAEAGRILNEVHRSAHSRAAYWLARQHLAQAAGDLVGLGTADERLAAMRAREWGPLEWRRRGRRATLEIYPEVERAGLLSLAIEIAQAPERGAAVEVLWDGDPVALTPVAAGGRLEVTVKVEPKPHLLELRSLAGGEVYPGRVRLEEAPSPDG